MGDGQAKKIVVIGASAGGISAIERILQGIGEGFPYPVLVVEHNRGGQISNLSAVFQRRLSMPTKEAEPNEKVQPGHVYVAPGDYHLLLEKTGELSLSVDDKVNFCRPSIDVLFDSVAAASGENTIAILLTGANKDGAEGILHLQEKGAQIFVQDPDEAEFNTMPLAAIQLARLERTYTLDEINQSLMAMPKGGDYVPTN